PTCRRSNIGEVKARLALDMGERELQLALCDLRQQHSLLICRSRSAQQTATEDDGCEIWLQHEATTERFHYDHRLDRTTSEAAMRLRERQTKEAEFGVLSPDGTAPAVRFRHVLLALLKLVLIGNEAVNTVFQQTLFVGEIKVHGSESQYRL